MTIPATMFALSIPLIIAWVCIIAVGNKGERPKPFDFEGWDNNLAKVTTEVKR